MLKTVALIFGGKSAEHEISVRSAKNVCEALDKSKFEPFLIGISKSGTWYHLNTIDELQKFSAITDAEIVRTTPNAEPLSFSCSAGSPSFHLMKSHRTIKVDIAFPILHGTLGEDGTIQGLFKMLNLPFVGCGVLSSAMGMDKDVMKKIFSAHGIPNAPYVLMTKEAKPIYAELVEKLGSPFFIKPANAGSSVGVHKIKSEQSFKTGCADAFLYDSKVLAEKFIPGREIECAVLGLNNQPKASVPGEVIPSHEFYSYEAKYLDDHGAKIEIPAKLTSAELEKLQSLAKKTFQALGCSGLTRVDFFLTKSGEILVNEINTIPGFTNISMYPKMWEHSGITYRDLISQLIDLGFEVHKQESHLQTNYEV